MSEKTVEPADDTVIPNVLEFVLGAGTEGTDPSADRARAKVLEVVQVFGDSVLELKHFAAGRAVQVGAGLVRTLAGTRAAEDFFVPSALLPADSHALFEPVAGGWVVVADPKWGVVIDGAGGRRAPTAARGADGLVRVAFDEDERAIIDLGSTVFVARAVHPSRKIPVQGHDSVDYPLLGIAGFMGFVAMMLGVALSVVPTPSRTTRNEEADPIITTLLSLAKPPPPAPPAPSVAAAAPKGHSGNPGEKHPRDPAPETRREKDTRIAQQAGIFAALAKNASLDSMLSDSGLAPSLDDGIKGLIGPKATQIGTNGLDDRAGGPGREGVIAYGKGIDPASRSPGGDNRFRPGAITRSGGDPVDAGVGGPPLIVGQLDRAQIDEVIKRNIAQIKYCYQRELTKNPGLGGKVTVRFVIAKDGSVSQAITKTSTLGNPAVESCINGRILRFQFPTPKGGGIVIVSYPFLFSQS